MLTGFYTVLYTVLMNWLDIRATNESTNNCLLIHIIQDNLLGNVLQPHDTHGHDALDAPLPHKYLG